MAAKDTNSSAILISKTIYTTSVYSVPFETTFIKTTVTDNPASVDAWINKARMNCTGVISMDISVSCLTSKALTLHLCFQRKCLIIKLDKLSDIPASLLSFCSDKSYYFFGVNIGDKVRRIKELDRYSSIEFANLIDTEGEKWKKHVSENLSVYQKVMMTHSFCTGKKTIMQVDGMELDSKKVKEAAVGAFSTYKAGEELFRAVYNRQLVKLCLN